MCLFFLTTGKCGSLSPGQGEGDQWRQNARLLGKGRSLVVAVLRMGLPVSQNPCSRLPQARPLHEPCRAVQNVIRIDSSTFQNDEIPRLRWETRRTRGILLKIDELVRDSFGIMLARTRSRFAVTTLFCDSKK